MSVNEYLNNMLNESIHDKYLFESCFLAGGAGSGKSYISDLMFNGQPVKFVNSDIVFEKLLIKNDLPFTIDSKNHQMYMKQMDTREAAKALSKSQFLLWVNSMLPLIIDGTGREYNRIAQQREILQYVGYDCEMVFINTSLKVALQRNVDRERKVPEEVATQAWYAVQENIGKFQELFGQDRFHIIDNNTNLEGESLKAFELKLFRMSMKILQTHLDNTTGRHIINMLKSSGKSYLSDLPDIDIDLVKKWK